MNPVLAVTVAQEFVMPSFTQDGGVAVAFFEGKKMLFCIPVGNQDEAIRLGVVFQTLFCQAIGRYLEIAGMVTTPTLPPPKP